MTWQPEDAEIRRNALALHKAWREAEKAFEDSDEHNDDFPDEFHAEMRAASADYYRKSDELRAEHRAQVDAIEKKYAKAPSPLRAAVNQAESAYEQAEGPALREDDDGNAVICAKSGLPIWDTDDVLSDEYSEEFVIREAVGLPPRPVEEEEIEEAA